MTNQEAFDKAVAGLAAQGFTRSVHLGGCQYRGPNGKKCALGHLIPDELYDPDMEGKLADHDRMRASLQIIGIDDTLACSLQDAHDNVYLSGGEYADVPETMRVMLRRVADKFGLTKPEVLLGPA